MDIKMQHPEKLEQLLQKTNPLKKMIAGENIDYDTSLALAIRTMDLLDWDYSALPDFLSSDGLHDFYADIISAILGDRSSNLAASCVQMYRSARKSTNFYINSDFFNLFKDISVKNLRFCDVDKPISAYMNFPSGCLVDEDGDKYRDVYVYVGPAKEFPVKIAKEEGNPPFESNDDLISIAVLSDTNCYTLNSYLPKDRNLSLHDGLRGIPHILKSDSKQIESDTLGVPMVSAQVLKLLAYIGTGEADIKEFRNEMRLRGGPGSPPVKKDRWKSRLVYGLVGFDWIKKVNYQNHEWGVREHLRWQRHGVENSLVKLKIIPAHKRERHIITAKRAMDMGA